MHLWSTLKLITIINFAATAVAHSYWIFNLAPDRFQGKSFKSTSLNKSGFSEKQNQFSKFSSYSAKTSTNSSLFLILTPLWKSYLLWIAAYSCQWHVHWIWQKKLETSLASFSHFLPRLLHSSSPWDFESISTLPAMRLSTQGNWHQLSKMEN